MNLAPQGISLDVLGEKNCKEEEPTVDDVRRRLAGAVAAVDHSPKISEPAFHNAQSRGVVMTDRINSAAGTELAAALVKCFAQPVGDASRVRGELSASFIAPCVGRDNAPRWRCGL